MCQPDDELSWRLKAETMHLRGDLEASLNLKVIDPEDMTVPLLKGRLPLPLPSRKLEVSMRHSH